LDFKCKKDLGLLDVLNQRKVSKYDMDKVFNEWMEVDNEFIVGED
jgi:hypothetical protein